ncbi:CBN-PRY-1 protein, partial [Aphelenchoides avenae]
MTISTSECERACWARSIESVLENRVVFDAFRQFLKASAQPSSQEAAASKCAAINNNACATVDVLDLHFMILAFRTHAEKRHPRTAQIALALHRRFISLRTGTVNVIPEEVRASISSRVHSIRPNLVPSPELFEPCVPYVWEFLCEQHSLFVCSKDFSELLHKLERDECGGERLADEARYEDDVPVASTSCATSTTNTLDSVVQEQSMIRVPPGISFGKFRQRKTRSRPRSEPPFAAPQG